MAGLNRVEVIGNLGRDPEVRHTNAGETITHLSIGISENWKDKTSGERKSRTEWVRVVVFGAVAKIAADYLRKGSKCYVAGQLRTRKYKDKDGAEKYATEVVLSGFNSQLILLDARKDGGGEATRDDADDLGQLAPAARQQSGGSFDLDDEVPW